MPEVGEGSPPSVPRTSTPMRPEERAGEALAGRDITVRQVPAAAHVANGMEHGPGPHGWPRRSRSAPATVTADAASGPADPFIDEPPETVQAGRSPSAAVAATGAGATEKTKLRATRAQSVRCRKESRMGSASGDRGGRQTVKPGNRRVVPRATASGVSRSVP